MKKSILLLALLFIACEENSNENQYKTLSPEFKIALEILEKKGFDTKNYQVLNLPYGNEQKVEKMISIENDCLFLIKDLVNESRNKHYSSDILLRNTIARELRIALKTDGSTAISSQWQLAFNEAVDNWNAGSDITESYSHGLLTQTSFLNMRIVPESESHHITVSYVNIIGAERTVIAASGFPNIFGQAFRSIYVNRGFAGALSYSEIVFAATHELGHSIGLRHTNWFDRNSDGFSDISNPDDYEGIGPGLNHISSTPMGLDPNSIMNAIVAPWVGFDYYDSKSLRVLYESVIPGRFNLFNYVRRYFNGYFFIDAEIPEQGNQYMWFYRELGKQSVKWELIRGEKKSKIEFMLEKGFKGKIQLLGVVDTKVSFITKEINFK
jgi:hypothetical protein